MVNQVRGGRQGEGGELEFGGGGKQVMFFTPLAMQEHREGIATFMQPKGGGILPI